MTTPRHTALDLTDRKLARAIAARIRTLVARHDDGDVTAAARRLQQPIADVYCPERVLSPGNRAAAIELLVSVVRKYDADACWLITGRTDASVSPEAREAIIQVLGELSDRLLDEVRRERRAHRPLH